MNYRKFLEKRSMLQLLSQMEVLLDDKEDMVKNCRRSLTGMIMGIDSKGELDDDYQSLKRHEDRMDRNKEDWFM